MKTAVRPPIDTICCEPKKTNLVRQGRTMPKQWTEGRFILTRLEVPTLREITAERRKTNLLMKSGVPGDSFIVSIVSAIFIFFAEYRYLFGFLDDISHMCVFSGFFLSSVETLRIFVYNINICKRIK